MIKETSGNNFPFGIIFQILLDFELQTLESIQIWIWLKI
jgi:hypothetical protein